LGIGLVVMGVLFLPRLGRAHTLGLSTAEFDVGASGRVAAKLTFATAEPLGTARPDSEADLRSFVLDGVDVTADGARCVAHYEGSGVTEVDGVVLEASYACPRGAGEIAVTLYYLSALRPGHREVARISGPPGSNATVEGVLTGDRRQLVLELPAAPGRRADARREALGRRVAILTVTFAVVMLSLFAWRLRTVRRARRAPPPR
jgi:hypothetical protein